MDALTGLLEGPRARNAFLLRAVLRPPFSVRVQDRAPLSLVAMVRGDAWLVGTDSVRLRPGDVAVVRGPDPYIFADDAATEPQVIIHPGQRCATPEGDEVFQTMDLGVRTWGNSPDGPVMALIGSYERHTEVSGRLLEALPPLLAQPCAGTRSSPCWRRRSERTARPRRWCLTGSWTSC